MMEDDWVTISPDTSVRIEDGVTISQGSELVYLSESEIEVISNLFKEVRKEMRDGRSEKS